MQVFQAQVAVTESFPVTLFFRTDNTMIFAGHQGMKAVIDQNECISGVFDADGFTLYEKQTEGKDVDEGQTYMYNVPYRLADMPVLTQWLKQQNLILPT
jgi:hypothetical protein